MEFDTLSVEIDDGVGRLVLDRPERKNAISPRMGRELAEALGALADDESVRVVVLRGAGGNFCSGGDLRGDGDEMGDVADADTNVLAEAYHPAVLALRAFPHPVIAVVEGVAAGAGVSLALGCDLVYAAEGARFSVLFVHRSLAPDCGATWLLPRLVGMQRAKEIALFGDWMDAQDALRMGLLSGVFSAEELDEQVGQRARRLAALPPLALAAAKRNLNAAFELELPEALEREADAQIALTRTEDFREAMAAFVERRPGRYRGR